MGQSSRWTVLWLALLLAAAPWAYAAKAEDERESEEQEAAGDGVSRKAGSSGPVDEGLTEYVEVNAEALPESNSIATRMEVPLQLTPANVGVVTRPLMDDQNSMTLGDALHNVSSLNVQAGPAVHDFFSVRGFDSLSSTLVMSDGAAEPQAAFYPMYNVEGVEVLKGPGGYLYGRRPLAGTVNMVRKQPVPADFLVLGGYAGSFNTGQGTLDWNTASGGGDVSFRLNGLWRETGGYRDDKDAQQTAINPGLTWKPSEALTLNFNVEYAQAEISPDAGLPLWAPDPTQQDQLVIPDVPRTQSYQSPFDFSDQEFLRGQFDLEAELSDRVKLRNKTYYRGLDWQSAGTLLNGTLPAFTGTGFDPTDPQAIRTLTTLDDRQVFVGNLFEAVIETSTGSVKHNLLTGLQIDRQSDDFTIEVLPPALSFLPGPGGIQVPYCETSQPGMPCISVFQPQESLTSLPPQLFPLEAGELRTTVIAPYVVDQMDFSGKFHLLVGLRYDSIDVQDDLRRISRDESELSPMLGAVWSPNADLSVYGNAGRAFAPPGDRVRGDLEPQRSTQLELGVKKKFLAGKLQTTFAAYRIDRDNIPVPDANGVTSQAGDQRSDGFEIELAAMPRRRMWTFLSYAFTDAELVRFFQEQPPGSGNIVDLSGNTPAYAPRHILNLWISQKFRSGLGFGVGGRYVSSQYFSPDNLYEVDSFVVADAAGFYDWKAWRFQVNFKNLLDEEYETGTFASTSVLPANPRSIFASVEYRF